MHAWLRVLCPPWLQGGMARHVSHVILVQGVREQSSLAFEEIQASPKSGIRNGEPLQGVPVHHNIFDSGGAAAAPHARQFQLSQH